MTRRLNEPTTTGKAIRPQNGRSHLNRRLTIGRYKAAERKASSQQSDQGMGWYNALEKKSPSERGERRIRGRGTEKLEWLLGESLVDQHRTRRSQESFEAFEKQPSVSKGVDMVRRNEEGHC